MIFKSIFVLLWALRLNTDLDSRRTLALHIILSEWDIWELTHSGCWALHYTQ